jgi:carbonic anhydrase
MKHNLINKNESTMRTINKGIQEAMSPRTALEILKRGNGRFVENIRLNRDHLEQINETRDGQFPFAIVLSCIDSRTSAELIFDQGLGDIFSVRIAGNVVNEDILGSIEFGCKVAGSKLIVVLGHTGCGAVKGACDYVEMGNLTGLLRKIQPAVMEENTFTEYRDSKNVLFVERVAMLNVHHSVRQILERSPIIREMVDAGEIGIVGGMYEVENGRVTFYEEDIFINDEVTAKTAVE